MIRVRGSAADAAFRLSCLMDPRSGCVFLAATAVVHRASSWMGVCEHWNFRLASEHRACRNPIAALDSAFDGTQHRQCQKLIVIGIQNHQVLPAFKHQPAIRRQNEARHTNDGDRQ